jgi:hypothetical protein
MLSVNSLRFSFSHTYVAGVSFPRVSVSLKYELIIGRARRARGGIFEFVP